jgi:CRISPR-associated endonuclease Cas2
MSRGESSATIVCYDFLNDKLRQKIEKALHDYGVRIQYSVFACLLSPEQVIRFEGRYLMFWKNMTII